MIRDISEYPDFIIHKEEGMLYKLLSRINLLIEIKVFNGLVFMTNELLSYYKDLTRRHIKFLLMPMTVEHDRFCNINDKRQDVNADYIAYCGAVRKKKDGVDILIKAFYRIVPQFNKLSLYIIGDISNNSSDVLEIKRLVDELGLRDKVIFTGKLNRELVPSYLANAKILALARPNSKQAEGGFPTKLGEYLSTGRPVVVTEVGEIPQYLKNNDTAFFAKPGSIEDFSEKLEYILRNPELAEAVGRRGKKLAENVFSYLSQARRLSDFIESL